VDCCYSRAHSMCRMMESKGIACEKYWYFSKDWPYSSDLHPRDRNGTPIMFPDKYGVDRPVRWKYHVAPLVTVVKADGTMQDMVMDPSLADCPLTKDEWKKIQGSPAGAYEETSDSKTYFSNKRFAYGEDDADMVKTCAMLETHKRTRDASLRAKQHNTKP